MANIQAVSGACEGFVMATFSRVAGGHVVSADLLRVWAKARRVVLMRRRVARAFSGYLVTEAGPVVVPAFSLRREWHQFGFNAYAATSSRWPLGLRGDFPHVCSGRGVAAGGPLDAPEEMAAGSVVSCMGEPHGRLVLRGEDYASLAGRLDRQGGVL